MIVGIFGLQGEGKTATLVEWLNSHYEAGYTIVTNVTSLRLPHREAKYETIKDANERNIPLPTLYGVQKIALGIDEILRWMGARGSMSEQNKVLSEFISQLAKNSITLAYTAQLERMPDIMLEEQTNHKISTEKLAFKQDGIQYILGFEQTWTDNKDGSQDTRFWSVEQAEPFFELYLRKEQIAKARQVTKK